MDQYVSAIIIAVITGIFGIITILIQNRQKKDVEKIDRSAAELKKEKKLKNDLEKAKNDLEATLHHIMILILDTNIEILKHTSSMDNISIDNTIYEAEQLKQQFNLVLNQIRSINHDYEILLEIRQELQSSSGENRRS